MNTTQRTPQEEIHAMTVIINIQMMQNKVYGKRFEYHQFNANTLEELYELQDQLIKEYNQTFKTA